MRRSQSGRRVEILILLGTSTASPFQKGAYPQTASPFQKGAYPQTASPFQKGAYPQTASPFFMK